MPIYARSYQSNNVLAGAQPSLLCSYADVRKELSKQLRAIKAITCWLACRATFCFYYSVVASTLCLATRGVRVEHFYIKDADQQTRK
jgi:hypothetical protein